MGEKKIKLARTQNAVRNIAAGLINKFVILICPFVVRTVMIQTLGVEYVGLNGLFTAILEVLNLSELGVGSAIAYSMYRAVAQDDKKMICALLGLYRKIYFLIGSAVMLAGVLLMPFLKFLIKGSYPQDMNLYLLYMVYLLNSCISYFCLGYKAVILEAYQRQDILQNIMSVMKFLMFGAQIMILWKFRSYFGYIILLPVFTVLINLITAQEVKRCYPHYRCEGIVPISEKKELKKRVYGLMVTKFCAVTRNSFDSIFISSFLGLAVSALYSNYYYVMRSLSYLMGIIVQAVLAGVGNSIQTESKEKNYQDLKKFNFMYMWIGGWWTTCLLCLFQPFMFLWMGEDKMLPFPVVILLCMYFFLLLLGDMQSVYYTAAGLWWYYRKPTVVEACLNLVLNFVLVQIWGLSGIIAGTLISLFLVNFLYCERLVFRHYFQNGRCGEFYGLQIRYAMSTFLVSVFTYILCRQIPYAGSVRDCATALLKRGGLCIFVPNLIFYFLYRKTDEFRRSYYWLRKSRKGQR